MHLKSFVLLFAIAAGVANCGAPPVPTSQAKNEDATPDSAGSLALKHHELFDSHAKLQSRTQTEGAEILFLTALNQKLCERLDALRQTCLPSYRIISDSQEKNLGCASQAKIATFSAQVNTSHDVQLVLVANNLFETNTFAQGNTALSFYSNFNSGSLVAPRFVDLSQLKLKAVSGVLPKLDSGFKFSFSVSGQELFNETHLTADDNSQSYFIRLDSMSVMKRSNKCVAGYEELDELTKNVKRDTISPTPPSETLDAKHQVEKNMPANTDDWKNLITDLQQKVANLEDSAEKKDVQLDFERDRQGKLTKELLGESALGCFAHQPIRKIELQIKGVHLEDGAVFETSDKEPAVGQAAFIQFQFGEQLKFNNNDEEKNSVFREDGRMVFEEKGNRKIGEIEFIKVEKGGVDFKNAQTCSQFLLFFKVCRQQNWETKRYRMDDFTVYINDQLFYKKTGANAVLERNSLTWEDRNLGMNPSYLQLMARTDCPVSQE